MGIENNLAENRNDSFKIAESLLGYTCAINRRNGILNGAVMGYYIDFVFEEDTVKDYQEVVRKFCNAGAKIFDPHDPDRPPQHSIVELEYPNFLGIIGVFKREAKNLRGNWAHVRLS